MTTHRDLTRARSSVYGYNRLLGWLLITLLLAGILGACGGDDGGRDSTFRILAGTENQSLEPIIEAFADGENTRIEVAYAGSIDIMHELAKGVDSQYDAVWPASGLWIQLGNTTGAAQLSTSIMRSPVVLGVKKSVADRLGWIGADVTVEDVLAAAESGQLTYMMANASQSDSGASTYFGLLYAFAGQPDVLTTAHLQDAELRDKMQRILGEVSRSAGSSGSLKELFMAEYDSYDAMFNYESAVIEANTTLVALGREPLYAVYLVDGTAIADFPLAYVSRGDDEKRDLFLALQEYLLSPEPQAQLLALGRRTGLSVNLDPAGLDQAVFNPDWGIDTQRILTPVRIPEADVVREALALYQSTFRKPSFTVFALDFSGSMADGGRDQLLAAMRVMLDQPTATQYFLQAAPGDVTVIIPFNDQVINTWVVHGNEAAALRELDSQINRLQAGGGTDIYSPVIAGLDVMQQQGIEGFFPSIVLLTDGESNQGKTLRHLEQYLDDSGLGPVPIFAITFGKAVEAQLLAIAELTSGAVFDGRADLTRAFRTARGSV